MRVAITTLGCKVNQYETQAMEGELLRRGHTLVEVDQAPDAYIINTCSVTAVSDKKSRALVRRYRRQAPQGVVAVCGCYVQTHGEEAEGLGADVLMGTNDRFGFLDCVEQAVATRQHIVHLDEALRRREFEFLPAGGLEGRTRALLKVEDGCVNFCTYCIIPYARGPVRSLSLEKAVAETRRLVEAGYREIVLTGIEISSWGRDLPGRPALIDLVEALCAAMAGRARLRLGSLEPRTITEEFCARAGRLDNLCPHFHLSLQSGSDTVLQRMGRKYDTRRYYESVTLLRRFFDHPAITTDLIVGFPGETEEEHGQSLAFARQCAFSALHIFPYSPRPGTPAAKLPGQIPKGVKATRAAGLARVALELEQAYLDSLVGREVQVLFECGKEQGAQGHGGNYVTVCVEGEAQANTLQQVTITSRRGDCLVGEIRATPCL